MINKREIMSGIDKWYCNLLANLKDVLHLCDLPSKGRIAFLVTACTQVTGLCGCLQYVWREPERGNLTTISPVPAA